MSWRQTLRTIGITATVTSVVWLGAGAWLFQRGDRARPISFLTIRPGQGATRPVQSNVTTKTPPVLSGSLAIPVVGVPREQLSDTFGDARAAGTRPHDAIDIMAPLGTPVIAAIDGRIDKLFQSHDGGNTVYQRSADGRFEFYYAHLDRYAPGLHDGSTVRRGDPIGIVGYSGNASPEGPHLHFAILVARQGGDWWDAKIPLNPYPLLNRR